MSDVILIAGDETFGAMLGARLGFEPNARVHVERENPAGGPQDETSWTAAVSRACEGGRRLAAVVNTLESPPYSFDTLDGLTPEAFDHAVLGTSARTFSALKACIPALRQGGGAFLTVFPYDTAHEEGLLLPTLLGGVEMLVRVTALEYAAPPSVRVNLFRWARGAIDLAAAVEIGSYLLSSDAAYVTGASVTLPVSGSDAR